MIRNDRRRTTRYHDLRLLADRRFAYGRLAFVGVRTTWIPGWIIDSGNYAGQRAVTPFAEIRSGMGTAFGWVPECDLVDIELYVHKDYPAEFR